MPVGVHGLVPLVIPAALLGVVQPPVQAVRGQSQKVTVDLERLLRLSRSEQALHKAVCRECVLWVAFQQGRERLDGARCVAVPEALLSELEPQFAVGWPQPNQLLEQRQSFLRLVRPDVVLRQGTHQCCVSRTGAQKELVLLGCFAGQAVPRVELSEKLPCVRACGIEPQSTLQFRDCLHLTVRRHVGSGQLDVQPWIVGSGSDLLAQRIQIRSAYGSRCENRGENHCDKYTCALHVLNQR